MSATKRLQGLPVLLSASVPDELKNSPKALDLFDAVTLLVRRVITAGGRVVFGGHPSIIPLVRRAAQAAGATEDKVDLYLLRRFRDQAPAEIYDRQVFGAIHWVGSEDGTAFLEEDLSTLRDAMVQASQAAIFIGGRTTGFLGNLPGIRDEYQRFLSQHEGGPVYLLGLLQGETSRIIADLEITGKREHNYLDDNSINFLHTSDDIDVIAPLVVKDLEKMIAAKNRTSTTHETYRSFPS